jgi:hypothetical protein
VQDWAQDAALFYPNPSEGVLYCKQAGQLKIYNSSGVLLFHKNIEAHQRIELGNLAAGLYIAEINGRRNAISIGK